MCQRESMHDLDADQAIKLVEHKEEEGCNQRLLCYRVVYYKAKAHCGCKFCPSPGPAHWAEPSCSLQEHYWWTKRQKEGDFRGSRRVGACSISCGNNPATGPDASPALFRLALRALPHPPGHAERNMPSGRGARLLTHPSPSPSWHHHHIATG